MIDFNKKIKSSDKFRQPAIFFEEHGYYTSAPVGTTDYYNYWKREADRCLNGYTAPDGDQITGYHYFYLNYSPIMKIVEVKYTDRNGVERTRRERLFRFPDFWDYDWYYFNAVEQAEQEGKHMVALKARARGYSFKGSSMLCRNYFLIPKSKNFAVASEQKYLTGDGLLTKAWQIMDFLDKNSGWAKRRLKATALERTSGFKVKDEITGKEVEDGYLSSITGITLKNDAERLRGTRGKLVLFEEAGKFPDIKQAWQVERPAVETDDGVAFGLLIAFGCVCAGTKVWTSSGDYVNIEDIKEEDGILGWDTYQAVQQHIDHINPPSKKECVQITTHTGRTLRCSKDHPLLWSKPELSKRVPGMRWKNEHQKKWLWHEAQKCQVGDQVGVIDSVPFFGTKKMWEPRLVGWLIGDGSYGYDKTPRLSNCEDEINTYIEENFDTSPDSTPRFTKDGKIYKETRIKGICPKLRELGIYGQTKDKKRLPINIHQYDQESLAELIGGLWDTDGSAAIDKNGRPRLSLSQSNEAILREIEGVLLHFGVHCNIIFVRPSGRSHICRGRTITDNKGYWRLQIGDITSIANFVSAIDCFVQYKQSAMDAMFAFTRSHLARYHKYVSGIHIERIVKIEDIGEQTIYNLTAKEQHNYIANGIVTHNTGGESGSDFEGLQDMFYHPEGYNCLGFPNIWDEGMSDKQCGFFVPAWSNLQSDLYPDCMDKDGNTNRTEAVKVLMEQREKVRQGQPDETVTDRYIAEHPITPQEAILEVGKNIFPKKQLQMQLSRIRTNKKLSSMKHVVDLTWGGDGTVVATEKKGGDITHYPLPLKGGDKPDGSVVIWEYPIKDPPFGLYIAGCDPVDHDGSITNSLASTFVYKRFKAGEAWTDVIVAEYTGRPSTAEEYYENVRKLLTMYNARLLFENERKGIYPYFVNKHCDYLLADQPDKVISEIFKDSKVQRRKGCHMTKQIRQYAEGLVKEWLLEEYAPGHPNLERVYSEPLIEELLLDDGERNVDRVIALCMVMIYREELYQVKIAETKKENKQVEFFEMPLFSAQWWDEEPSTSIDTGIQTFSF